MDLKVHDYEEGPSSFGTPAAISGAMRNRSTRLAAFDYIGAWRYSLTYCCEDRAERFRDPAIVGVALTQLQRACDREGFDLLAYCLMPDHAHLLLAGREPTSDLRRFIKLSKQLTEHAVRRLTGEPLWQASAWDHVLRDDEDTFTVIRYLLANPVRAGLVEHPLDYPHSGSFVYTRQDLVSAFDRP